MQLKLKTVQIFINNMSFDCRLQVPMKLLKCFNYFHPCLDNFRQNWTGFRFYMISWSLLKIQVYNKLWILPLLSESFPQFQQNTSYFLLCQSWILVHSLGPTPSNQQYLGPSLKRSPGDQMKPAVSSDTRVTLMITFLIWSLGYCSLTLT